VKTEQAIERQGTFGSVRGTLCWMRFPRGDGRAARSAGRIKPPTAITTAAITGRMTQTLRAPLPSPAFRLLLLGWRLLHFGLAQDFVYSAAPLRIEGADIALRFRKKAVEWCLELQPDRLCLSRSRARAVSRQQPALRARANHASGRRGRSCAGYFRGRIIAEKRLFVALPSFAQAVGRYL